MPLDKDKMEELLQEGAQPDTSIELDWVAVRDWPDELAVLVLDTDQLDELYELLRKVPVDSPEYHTCMEFLRTARQERRRELSLAILELHGINLPDLPQKDGKDGHDPDVLGGGHPL